MFTSFKLWFLSKSLIMIISSLLVILLMIFSMEKTIIFFDMNSYLEVPFSMTLMLDKQSFTFISTVLLVSSMIVMYSFYYLEEEIKYSKGKFLFILLFFILSMLILSSSANLFWLMVGWDGLGITSFCLVIFYQNWKSLGSGMVTFLSNRLGDTLIIVSMIWIIMNQSSNSWMFPKFTFFIPLLTILGAYSKSAQLPYLFWLPQAMAAPTPVSALVHSSTLVTAGVYMVCRFQPIDNQSSISVIFFFISCITVLIAGTSSLMEFDLKKVIALSTLCHISLMMMFSILGEVNLSLFHLMMHAFFKSLLFMVAGLIIHENNNLQDIRNISIMKTNLSISFPFFISILSMMGFPFLSGFYSKESLLMKSSILLPNLLMLVLFLLNSFFSCAYSARLMIFMFSNQLKKISVLMKSPLMLVLFSSSILSSFAGGWTIFFMIPEEEMVQPPMIKLLLLLSSILGIALGMVISMNTSRLLNPIAELWKSNLIYKFFQKHFFLSSSFLMWTLDEKGITKSIYTHTMSMMSSSFKFFAKMFLKEPFSLMKTFHFFFMVVFIWVI